MEISPPPHRWLQLPSSPTRNRIIDLAKTKETGKKHTKKHPLPVPCSTWQTMLNWGFVFGLFHFLGAMKKDRTEKTTRRQRGLCDAFVSWTRSNDVFCSDATLACFKLLGLRVSIFPTVSWKAVKRLELFEWRYVHTIYIYTYTYKGI